MLFSLSSMSNTLRIATEPGGGMKALLNFLSYTLTASACNRFLITLFCHFGCAPEIGFFAARFPFDEDDSLCVTFMDY